MTSTHTTIHEAIAEIELLSNSGYVSFKLGKRNGFWEIEAK
jgi:hypothetical protein